VPPALPNGSSNGHHSNGHPTIGRAMTSIPIPVAATSGPGSADSQVLASFQETMRAFLDVQRATMLAYLAGRQVSIVPTPTSGPFPRTEPVAGRITSEVFEPKRPEPTRAPVAEPIRSEPVSEVVPTPATRTDREEIAVKLVEIVRDRTGYPAEMLGLELDLEADLGIDSIKRVEILGSLRDAVPTLGESNDPSTMDALSRARTLGAIVAKVVEIAGRLEVAPVKPELSPASPSRAIPMSPVRRMVLGVVPAPLPEDRPGLPMGGVVVVTDDGRGVARGVAARLEASGLSVILAGSGEVDFASPSSVEGLLDLARSAGEVVGIVHALPLRAQSAANLDREAWSDRIGPEVKGLFLLARAAAGDLEKASRRGGAALVAATAMGGTFATGPDAFDFFPGHGGVAGLVKTLAREWPTVRARVVDFNPNDGMPSIAARLADEMITDDGWAEVGYSAGRRVRIQGVPSALDRSIAPRLELVANEPIIVTGGARGITATVAAELARRWRPTLLLLGRNPLPPGTEFIETAGVDAQAELKRILHARLRRDGHSVSPPELERAYQRLQQEREIRRNLDAFRTCGATVDYAPVDVRDTDALARVLDAWRTRFGEPVGLIHGAGVIKDKLIRDKSPDVFDQVLGT
jgi:NAD(P)-dependent dehydrogenase (short-subunit alcohol dehydrogenase family)/acyl carrier protein